MKTVFKKTVLLGAGFLAGMVALPHDFSAPTHPDIYQRFDPVTTSDQAYEFNTQKPEDDILRRIPRHFVEVNTTLAELQAGIYGDSRAEILTLASRE